MNPLTARKDDLARVRRVLAEATGGKLALLTGPQGVGKTLLVRRALGEHPALEDRHLYVDVQHVRSLEELGWALLSKLEPVPITSPQDLQALQATHIHARIARLLAHNKTMLVLDQLDRTLLDQWEAVRDLLGAREPSFQGCLCIAQHERALDVPGTPYAHLAEVDVSTLHTILREELSPRRYSQVTGDEDSRQALDAILALCMGRPLWLVMWSRRLELMSPHELLAAIHQGHALAHGAPHSMLMEGLRGVLPEQAWLAWVKCSVFEDAFPVLMAEQMYGDELLEPLELLRDHGIVEVVSTPDEVMCRIHPMCRSHVLGGCHDALTTQTLEQARLTHDTYFARCAIDHMQEIKAAFDHEQVKWLAQYVRELRVACARELVEEDGSLAMEQALVLVALSRGDWSGAFELSSSWRIEEREELLCTWSAPIWLDVLGSSDEPMRGLEFAQRWLGALCTCHDFTTQRLMDSLKLAMVVRAAEIASWLERTTVIAPLVEQGLLLATGPSHRVERGRLLLVNALMHIHARDWFTAQAMCQEAAHLFKIAQHVRFMGKTACHLAHVYKHLWKGEESLKEYERALWCATESQDVSVLTQTYRELAWLWLDLGEIERAQAQIQGLEALMSRHDTSWIRGVLCMLRGQVAMQRGEYAEALVELEASRWHLASSQQHYMLTATLYFEFLCYWARGEIEQARVYKALGEGMSDQITSIMALTCYDCARIVLDLFDGEIEQAEQVLAQSRARHEESRSSSWLGSLIDVHAFYIELTRYMNLPRHNTRKASALADQICAQGVDLQARYNRGGLVTDFNAEVRLCWGIITAKMPVEIREQIELGMIDPSGEAFIIDRARQTFRAPHSATWVDMSRREVPFRLLSVLADQRVESPGQPIDATELFERVWPGESILQESAQNRLYVTIASLRKEGLREYLSSVQGGYLLDAQMRLIDI